MKRDLTLGGGDKIADWGGGAGRGIERNDSSCQTGRCHGTHGTCLRDT